MRVRNGLHTRARLGLLGAAVAIAAVAVPAVTTDETATAAAPAAPAQGTSTLDDQTELALTVYNSNIALVRDVRTLQLPRGTFDLQFMDIAATVNPATVHFRSLSEPSRVSVLEQNYEYDLLEPDKLLRKYVGRDVTLVRQRQEGGRTIEEPVTARLLSYNNAPVWQIGNEIVTGLGADHIRFPELPGNLFSRPTLIWSLSNDGGARHRVEASYLATNLKWNADYVLTVARDDKTRRHRRLGHRDQRQRHRLPQRVAATCRRRSESRLSRRRAMPKLDERVMKMAAANAAREMTQESFSDYHLYTFGRKTTINNNQTKQVSMLDATGFPVVKRYVVNGQAFYYRNAYAARITDQGRRAGVLSVQERRQGGPGHPDAGRRRARLPVRLERWHAVRRRGSHRAHTDG